MNSKDHPFRDSVRSFIQSKSVEILSLWAERVLFETSKVSKIGQPVLIDRMADYLSRLPNCSEVESERLANCRLCGVCDFRGINRFSICSLTLEQVLHEYSILRSVLVFVIGNCEALRQEDLNNIHKSIDRAMRFAGETFWFKSADEEKNLRLAAESERNQVQLAKKAVEEELRLKIQFVTRLSHDLRNPLATARMALDALPQHNPASSDWQKLINMISRNIDRAENMIHDLLDMSRINAGVILPLNLVFCDLARMVKKNVEDLSLFCKKQIILDIDEEACGYWCSEKLSRVFDNLLGNALKYGKDDQPINIQLHQSIHHTTLIVQNYGTIIPLATQHKIFEPFFRICSNEKGNQDGWGIGLGFVKSITEAHGGVVEVSSTPDEGTIFKVILPNDARPFNNNRYQSH